MFDSKHARVGKVLKCVFIRRNVLIIICFEASKFHIHEKRKRKRKKKKEKEKKRDDCSNICKRASNEWGFLEVQIDPFKRPR